jgi:glucose/mannose-6-phosphate isomerase
LSEINLDDATIYESLDPSGMFDCLREMPEQCRRAWELSESFKIPPDYSRAKKIVVLGMGGSAIGGDLVSSLVSADCTAPVITCRGYDLPAFVDENTLVIASSYSGGTEETLSAFEQALATDAFKLVITTGGKLGTIAEATRIPVFTFDYKAQPRAALPYSLFPLLRFLQKMYFIPDQQATITETLEVLASLSTSLNSEVPEAQNPAKKLARLLYGKTAIVYGAGITAEAAHRWKTQINENSKAWCFHEVFPELNHNAVVGYEFPPEAAKDYFVLLLKSSLIHPRVQKRYEVTQTLLGKAGVGHQVVQMEGASALSQLMGMVMLGDYVSCYLAMLNEADPTPVSAIDYLKGQLAKGG